MRPAVLRSASGQFFPGHSFLGYTNSGGPPLMLTFPLHNAALDLKDKPPKELPHGLLPIPLEVRELVEMERAKHPPDAFAKAEEGLLNDWTVHWYFENL